MGSTFCVREGAAWMPQAGYFRDTLKAVADELRPDGFPVECFLPQAWAWAFADVSTLEADLFARLLDGMQRSFNRMTREGVPYPSDAVRHFIFMSHFSHLKVLMLTDPRLPVEQDSGQIVIRGEAVWQAPAWIHDFVLERIAEEQSVRPVYPELEAMLLSARANEGTGYLELAPVPNVEFDAIVQALNWTQRFHNEVEQKLFSPFEDHRDIALASKVDELHRLLHADVVFRNPPAG